MEAEKLNNGNRKSGSCEDVYKRQEQYKKVLQDLFQFDTEILEQGEKE